MLKSTLIFLASVAIAASQGIEALPPCSLACFIEHVPSTGCGLYDFACSCIRASELTPKLTPCVQSACEVEDQGRVVSALQDICSAVGVPIPMITGQPPPELASSAVDEPIPTVLPEPTSTLYEEPEQTSADLWLTATPSHTSSDYALPSEVYDEPPEVTTTVTSTKTHFETTVLPQFPSSSPLPSTTTPPYPVSSAWPTSLKPSGTGSLRPSTPAFTAAAAAVGPRSLVGVLGLLVYVL
ncbi:hypothetical protein IQ07DRAFT_642512 [Pyrenochaeta sp. DS3sAY3a]|nr:hypothetical protein IQ07DRAFT_642512 [Pyrenochaeta sp. DS3sAY3a]